MLVDKNTNETLIRGVDSLPLILALNAGGEVLSWITYQESAFYAAKDKILWSSGEYEVTLHGGTNAITGKQSTLTIDTIIALDNKTSPSRYRRPSPALTNRELFARDRNLCAYCVTVYTHKHLTRDHIVPRSKGGPDIWENVVTSCKNCNQKKDDMSLTQAGLTLSYVPYEPSYNEAFILKNRRILQDQLTYLLKGVSPKSRLHGAIEDGLVLPF